MNETLLCDRQIAQKEEPIRTKKICFVCSGNTCRSPMAEAVANAIAREKADALPDIFRELFVPEWEAFSRGLSANDGEPIAKNAVTALTEKGIPPIHDYTTHIAHNLTQAEAEGCDLLIGMTKSHANELFFRYPQWANKIRAMPTDIADPYGGDEETYRRSLEQILDGVRKLLSAEGL